MTKLGDRLIESAKEARAIARGEATPARIVLPAPIDVAEIRRKTGLSQEKFARRFGLPTAIVRDWEQKRRNPDAAARALLIVIDKEPDAVERALASVAA